MSFIILVSVFVVSCLLIYFAGEWVVDGVMKVAQYLGWKEFVLSFSYGFLDLFQIYLLEYLLHCKGIPELSLGEVISGNIIDLTIIVALPILLTGRFIAVESKTIDITLSFILGATIFPLMLCLDGTLSRVDGVLLIFFYFTYIFWLFAKKKDLVKYMTKKIFQMI